MIFCPVLFAVTLTGNWQVPLAATVAPVRDIVVLPAFAVSVPPQIGPVAPPELATTRPLGKLSVKPTPVRLEAFVLLMVKVSDVLCPILIDEAPNAFVIEGGESVVTLIDAFAVPPLPPSFEVTLLVTLFLLPPVVAATLTENWQVPLAATVAPANDTELLPELAVTVPPQSDPVAPPLATTRPLGKLSVKPTPVRVVEVFVLLMVKVSEVLCPTLIDEAPNTLVIDGAMALTTCGLPVSDPVLALSVPSPL